MEEVVIIVGAGPSGLAAAVCLGQLSVPSLVLERDDCIGSLWRKRSYDRVRLHLAKQYCQLPYAPHPDSAPTYLPKDDFIRYLDDYADRFGVRVRFQRQVESARFDEAVGKWKLEVRNLEKEGNVMEEYVAKFLVTAAGENAEKVVPKIDGIEGFGGKVMHASEYRSAAGLEGKAVLVVGCGNSGMEIAYDLAEVGARTSIVARSELHLVTKEIWNLGISLLKFLPMNLVDIFVLFLCRLVFGDTSKYGLRRPSIGPFYMKVHTPVYPVVDVGTYKKIKKGEIKVLPALKGINGDLVEFSDGKLYQFDTIIFATGYRSTTKEWLKNEDWLFGDDGMAKQNPDHWKGRNGLYCIGYARKGLKGSSEESQHVADDISKEYKSEQANGLN